jgi:thiol:disulfide interchange protein
MAVLCVSVFSYHAVCRTGVRAVLRFSGDSILRSKVRFCVGISVLGLFAGGCASTAAPAASTSGVNAAAATVSTSATASGAGGQFPIPTGYDAGRDATADIQAALGLAKASHKEVLLDFGADWCPDCVALDKMFHAAQVESLLNSSYVVVPIDVGDWNLNLAVAGDYVDLNTSGIPALVVISDSGQVREATNDGSFENARTMDPSQVASFLTTWAPTPSR